MKITGNTTESERIIWYSKREVLKGNPEAEKDQKPFPTCFIPTEWLIVELENPEELDSLVFLEVPWTIKNRLVLPGVNNGRLLGGAVERALNNGYFLDEDYQAHNKQGYYEKMPEGHYLPLNGTNRIILRDMTTGEKRNNPNGTFYLHDGNGRCLAYLALIKEGKIPFNPVEAFLIHGTDDFITFLCQNSG